ncbi:MAG: hypothetical protein GY928_29315, partial [Colwellia sp.]|nr:hypothetical protein [Colwellia sp.]
MGSAKCGACDEYNIVWIIFIAVLSLLFVALIFADSKRISLKEYEKDEINWKYLFRKDGTLFMTVLLFKIIAYYSQALSEILSNESLKYNALIPVLGLFNLSIDDINKSENGVCIIPYLAALDEIIMSQIFVMFVFFYFGCACLALLLYRRYLNGKRERTETALVKMQNEQNTNELKDSNQNLN